MVCGCRNGLAGLAAVGACVAGSTLAGAAPPSSPLERPEFSIDRASPLVFHGPLLPGDVLERGIIRPKVALPSRGLRLFAPADDIDALSGPHLEFAEEDTLSILFSVDRNTRGIRAPDPSFLALGLPYNVRDQAQRRHAAGDTFLVADPFDKAGLLPIGQSAYDNNLLGLNNFDEGGSDLTIGPPTHASTRLAPGTPIDRLDALAHLPRDTRGDIAAAYFSLTRSSPSLELFEGTGADVFVAFVAREGACCLDDQCFVATRPECQAAGGAWLGPGSTCDDCTRRVGACCLPDGCVDHLPMIMCRMLDGTFRPGATCADTDCARAIRGACCLDGDRCYEGVREPVCAAEGGTFYPGRHCAEVPCRPIDGLRAGTAVSAGPKGESRHCDEPAACCFPDGACAVVDVVVCTSAGGVPLDGPDACAACTPPGACCLPNGACIEVNVATCVLVGGEWRGPGTRCDDACERSPREPMLARYASFVQLGLVPGDDIDALVVLDEDMDGAFRARDRVLFSLAPGSPSLATIEGASGPAAAADVFVVEPGAAPRVFAPARAFGLGLPVDNVDAIELILEDETAALHAIRDCPQEE